PASVGTPPDASCLGIGGRATEDTPEHRQCQLHPARLIDRCNSVSLHARNKKDNEHALAPAFQDPLSLARLACWRLGHARSIWIVCALYSIWTTRALRTLVT